MKVQEILAEFDIEGKKFDFLSYSSCYRTCPKEERKTIAYQAEVMASELVEGYVSDIDVFHGRFYFGPYWVAQDKKTGTIIEIPDRNLITAEMIAYWEARVRKTKNIILKARYCGMLWDFKSYITGEKCSIDIARTYILSLITLINNDFLSYSMDGIQHAERAIKLSKKLGLSDLLGEAKQALHNVILRYGDENAISIWGAAYRISIECPDSYTKEEQAVLITDLEMRFTRIRDMLVSGDGEKKDPWILMDLAAILAGYYKQHSPNKMENLFENVEIAFDTMSAELAKFQMVENYRRLYNLVIKYGLKNRASRLLVKMAKFGEGIQDEMTEFKQEVTISKEKMDSFVNHILRGDDIDTLFGRFTYSFIPQKTQEKESFDRLIKEAPIIYMVPRSIFDDRGRVKAVVGSLHSDYDGNIVVHTSMSMKLNSVFLHAVIEEGRSRNIFTIENILSFITQSPSISADRIPIITQGLEAYFNQNYLVSIHLLIPQLEAIIRNILEIDNIPTLKPCRSGRGFQLRVLDEMLRDPNAIHLLTDDFANYLRILLTDNRGWNLRNEICHGFASPNIFDKTTADRVFHALLCFGVFILKE